MKIAITSLLFTLLAPVQSWAEDPSVQAVSLSKQGDSWTISVTLRHPDTGWDHYADGWEVLDMAGNRLGFRKLAHPHVNEQPFTRSLSGVTIPPGATAIQIRPRDNVDGWAAESYTKKLDSDG